MCLPPVSSEIILSPLHGLRAEHSLAREDTLSLDHRDRNFPFPVVSDLFLIGNTNIGLVSHRTAYHSDTNPITDNNIATVMLKGHCVTTGVWSRRSLRSVSQWEVAASTVATMPRITSDNPNLRAPSCNWIASGVGRLLTHGSEKTNGAKTKGGHGKRGSNPGESGAVERKLSTELGHPGAILRQINPWVRSLLIHDEGILDTRELCARTVLQRD